jgi:hypothetical protein
MADWRRKSTAWLILAPIAGQAQGTGGPGGSPASPELGAGARQSLQEDLLGRIHLNWDAAELDSGRRSFGYATRIF